MFCVKGKISSPHGKNVTRYGCFRRRRLVSHVLRTLPYNNSSIDLWDKFGRREVSLRVRRLADVYRYVFFSDGYSYIIFARTINEMADIVERSSQFFGSDNNLAPEIKFISMTTLERITGGCEDEVVAFSAALLDQVSSYRPGYKEGTSFQADEPYVEGPALEPLMPDPSEGYFVPEDDFYLEEFRGLSRYRWFFNVTNFTNALRLDWDV